MINTLTRARKLCLDKAKLSAGREKTVATASGGAAAKPAAGAAPAAVAPAAAGAAPAAAAAPTAIVLRPMRPREELFVLRSTCGADVRSICGGVPAGGGRIVQYLATNAAQLSPDGRKCCRNSRRAKSYALRRSSAAAEPVASSAESRPQT
jgi:hypothetical protein